MDAHSTPIKAHSNKEEWVLRSPPRSGYSPSPFSGHRGSPYGRDDHRSSHDVQWASEDQEPAHGGLWGREEWKEVEPTSIPDFIPEEEGAQQLYPSRQKHRGMRTTPHISLTQ